MDLWHPSLPDVLLVGDEVVVDVPQDVDIPEPASGLLKGQEEEDQGTKESSGDDEMEDSVMTVEDDVEEENCEENCVVLDRSGADTREEAIRFIESLPESMVINSITMRVVYGPKDGAAAAGGDASKDGAEGASEHTPGGGAEGTTDPPKGQSDDTGPGKDPSPISRGAKRGKTKSHAKGCFTCAFCGLTYTQTSNLSRHVKQKHKPREEIVCTECGSVFERQDYLRSHSRKCQKEQLQ